MSEEVLGVMDDELTLQLWLGHTDLRRHPRFAIQTFVTGTMMGRTLRDAEFLIEVDDRLTELAQRDEVTRLPPRFLFEMAQRTC